MMSLLLFSIACPWSSFFDHIFDRLQNIESKNSVSCQSSRQYPISCQSKASISCQSKTSIKTIDQSIKLRPSQLSEQKSIQNCSFVEFEPVVRAVSPVSVVRAEVSIKLPVRGDRKSQKHNDQYQVSTMSR